MNTIVIRSDKEIDELADMVADAIAEGQSKYIGMTYEDGIAYTLKWLFDKGEPHPLLDEDEEDA